MRSKSLLAGLLASLLIVVGCETGRNEKIKVPASQPQNPSTKRAGGLDVTFFVTGDTHFGADAMSVVNGERTRQPITQWHDRIIEQMNHMAGTAYPAKIGGKVGTPKAALIVGDLTDNGEPDQWAQFEQYYGLNGKDGKLDLPVYETIGNHDEYSGDGLVTREVEKRHGGTYYSWDWGDLHMVCLAKAPFDAQLAWLKKDLPKVGKARPIVLFFHYPLLGPYSKEWTYADGDYPAKLAEIIKGYNVIAIFHGHAHATGAYQYAGYDVFNVGSPKHAAKGFAVVHVTDKRLTVAEWNYQSKGWWWWHAKPINRASSQPEKPGERLLEKAPQSGMWPLIPYPDKPQ